MRQRQQKAGHHGTCDGCGEPFVPGDLVVVDENNMIICPLCNSEDIIEQDRKNNEETEWGDYDIGS